jgi:hypothetical protein
MAMFVEARGFVQFTVGEKTTIRGGLRAVECDLDPAVEGATQSRLFASPVACP